MAKLALITGASTGIGFELAHLAADNGYDLIIAADEALIESAAADLRTKNIAVTAIEADLSTFEGVDRVLAAANGRPLDLVCANAGRGLGHGFLDQSVADWTKVIDTNITGTLYLVQKVLTEMVARNDGKLLITGSIAGFIPGSFQAVYNSSKSFIDSFADAVRNELKDSDGVTITTLMPGPTETEFFDRADMLDTQVGADDSKADPAKVARDGWAALMAGDAHIVSGFQNKLQVAAAHVLPAAMLAERHRKMAESVTAE
ncbi:SDR family NAD(P)-dependent oxidoreductase [Polymorphobacter fuscus]|uniref:SDR family NAD(P)-dependent oxidoreductase n=1 Tax=Sandarakinorhabdus fusca TaxID=1439888 RepID=A0A7C9GMG5_9SPHN|nr:SDR family NAD(P)-dependent oxidoreductase [Polymorphobacter fuscus]KAB7648472.1 SDR family NAD(P)-dependent oxidoreductase [Polymorphobacter fuscus]MQT15997.1 SDR family NAD(P)-dependent oxidoreductase [Polymorphobacter fuscus]NJC07726.1 short-subunit dehydrogenase [Polymorphobacter fuscus]